MAETQSVGGGALGVLGLRTEVEEVLALDLQGHCSLALCCRVTVLERPHYSFRHISWLLYQYFI